MKIRRHTAVLLGAIGFFAAVILIAAGKCSAAGQYRNYVMDNNYFSCEIPIDWELTREKEKDEEYRIYEIMLTPKGGQISASIVVSYYAKDNEDFSDHNNFLARNSRNILGETKNSREEYGPVKEVRLKGGAGFELGRERLVFLSPKSKSDASEAIKELLYVLPSSEGGFHVLHYKAPREFFDGLLPVFKKVAGSFMPLISEPPMTPSESILRYLNGGNGDPRMVRKYIEDGADVNTSDDTHRITPLHNAVHFKNMEAAKVLIHHGANVNAENGEGNTPLYIAVHRNLPDEFIAFLIEKGADATVRNKYGYTPLRAASRNGRSSIAKMLLDKGAGVNVRDKKGDTPLLVAIDSGHVDAARFLVENGADINAVGMHGDTSLHIAVARGQAEVVRLLLGKGADCNVTREGRDGGTPLQIAAHFGYADIVKLLISKGANANTKDNDGNTALDIAIRKGNTEIVEVLRSIAKGNAANI
jgi:ankyrin repeat protein